MIMRLEEEYEIWAMMDVRRVMKAHTLVFLLYRSSIKAKKRSPAPYWYNVRLPYLICEVPLYLEN